MQDTFEFEPLSDELLHDYAAKAAIRTLGDAASAKDILEHAQSCVTFGQGWHEGFRTAEIFYQVKTSTVNAMKQHVGEKLSPEVEARIKKMVQARTEETLKDIVQRIGAKK